MLAPSFGRLGRAWIWTGPNWNQIAQADRPTSNSTAQPGQGRSRQLTTPTGTLFFCPGFLQVWTYSLSPAHSVHSPARPPPSLASSRHKGQIKPNQYIPSPPQQYPSLHSTLFAAVCPSPRLLSNFSSRPSLLCRSCSSSSSFPRPPLHAAPQVALGCHEASRPRSIDGTPGSLAVLCDPASTRHRPRRAQRDLRLG